MATNVPDNDAGGLAEGFPEAEWPPVLAPEYMICNSCEYPIGGLRVERPLGTITCPECGVRARLLNRDDGARHLNEYAVACRNAQGRDYTVDLIAASMGEAQAIARSDGHVVLTIDAPYTLPTHDPSFPIAILAGVVALAGLFHWVIALVALGLGFAAYSISRGRRGMGIMVLSACAAAAHLILLWITGRTWP